MRKGLSVAELGDLLDFFVRGVGMVVVADPGEMPEFRLPRMWMALRGDHDRKPDFCLLPSRF